MRVSAPRVLHDGLALEGMPEGERHGGGSALVTQGGRVGEAELLDLNFPDVTAAGSVAAFSDGRDVLNAVRTWQLAPAQSRTGRPVAVTVVYLFAQTTAVKESARAFETVPGRRVIRPVVEPVQGASRCPPVPRLRDRAILNDGLKPSATATSVLVTLLSASVARTITPRALDLAVQRSARTARHASRRCRRADRS